MNLAQLRKVNKKSILNSLKGSSVKKVIVNEENWEEMQEYAGKILTQVVKHTDFEEKKVKLQKLIRHIDDLSSKSEDDSQWNLEIIITTPVNCYPESIKVQGNNYISMVKPVVVQKLVELYDDYYNKSV
jgi:hypothetical protein